MKKLSLAAYCVPFGIFLLLFGLIDILGTWGIAKPQYWVYAGQTVLCGALLLVFWRQYRLAFPRGILFAVAVAVLVFAIWVSPQEFFGRPPRLEGFDPTVFPPGSPVYWGNLLLRLVRLAVVVPLLEEVFWRGFLLRYLIREDFESVAFGTFSWLSFGLVTVFFALEHQPADYAAAFVTGALYNWIAIRTRSLSSCILAHAITNLLLGIYIMTTRQWGFW